LVALRRKLSCQGRFRKKVKFAAGRATRRTARRSVADDFAIEPALQVLREAFEGNQLAVEPVHRQLTAQLLDAFAQFDDNLLSR